MIKEDEGFDMCVVFTVEKLIYCIFFDSWDINEREGNKVNLLLTMSAVD